MFQLSKTVLPSLQLNSFTAKYLKFWPNLCFYLQFWHFFHDFCVTNKTWFDVLITKHNVSHESIVKYRNNYVLKIFNCQLVDLFFICFFLCFFSKILFFFSLFSFFLPFSSFFHSPPTLTLLCLSEMHEVTLPVASPAADGLKTRGRCTPSKKWRKFPF